MASSTAYRRLRGLTDRMGACEGVGRRSGSHCGEEAANLSGEEGEVRSDGEERCREWRAGRRTLAARRERRGEGG